MSDISIHAGDQMSEIEKFIADKQYDFDGRGMLVIDADDLREFMKGKVLLPIDVAKHASYALERFSQDECEDGTGRTYTVAMRTIDWAIEDALKSEQHPTSSGDKQ